MPQRKTIQGTLTNSAGRPINNAVIMIVDGTAEFNDIASVSNEQGEFFISNIVVPGTYTLQINNAGSQAKRKLQVGEQDTLVRVTF